MNDNTRSLQALVDRVQRLVDEERWDELAGLDDSARSVVEQATTVAREDGDDEAQVRALVEQLVALYERARSRAEEERDEAERGLRESNRTQRAANAYLNNQ